MRAELSWHRRPADRSKPWVVHINTTASGGGVAELLDGLGRTDEREAHESAWALLSAPPEFFALTKGLHHMFHGRGRSADLDASAQALYRAVTGGPFDDVLDELVDGDVVVLHDAQTLGLVQAIRTSCPGIRVIWHCHVGSLEDPASVKPALWEFFERDLSAVDRIFVSRAGYLRGAAGAARVSEVRPALDAHSAKNRALPSRDVREALGQVGLLDGVPAASGVRTWQDSAIPEDAVVVLQISRWDPLKGMVDLLRGVDLLEPSVHVVLAGPDPDEIVDDPEGRSQLAAVLDALRALEPAQAARVHVVAMTMTAPEANALWVNALQRRADIVVQRSLEEGFGLTVTEAMYKARPVIGSRVGGIALQIEDGVTGLLVDAEDDAAFAEAVNRLARDPASRRRLGIAARRSVRERHLMDRLRSDYAAGMAELATGRA